MWWLRSHAGDAVHAVEALPVVIGRDSAAVSSGMAADAPRKLVGLVPATQRAVSRRQAQLSAAGEDGGSGGLVIQTVSERPICIVRAGKLQPVWPAHGVVSLRGGGAVVLDGYA
eukprot:SAG31_NODE_24232_length_486_cov_0.919897_1_plen_113_part_10